MKNLARILTYGPIRRNAAADDDGAGGVSVVFLLDHGQDIQLATYDAGMAKAGRAMKIRLYSL